MLVIWQKQHGSETHRHAMFMQGMLHNVVVTDTNGTRCYKPVDHSTCTDRNVVDVLTCKPCSRTIHVVEGERLHERTEEHTRDMRTQADKCGIFMVTMTLIRVL